MGAEVCQFDTGVCERCKKSRDEWHRLGIPGTWYCQTMAGLYQPRLCGHPLDAHSLAVGSVDDDDYVCLDCDLEDDERNWHAFVASPEGKSNE